MTCQGERVSEREGERERGRDSAGPNDDNDKRMREPVRDASHDPRNPD